MDAITLYGINISGGLNPYFYFQNENKGRRFFFSQKVITRKDSLEEYFNEKNNKFLDHEAFSKALQEASWGPLSKDEIDKLEKVCISYPWAFAHGNHELGVAKDYEMDLKMTIQPPYPPILRKLPYMASPKVRQIIEEHLTDLIHKGILEKVENSDEEAVHSPVLISYDHNKTRLVGDFRALNSYTVGDTYPMPRIDVNLSIMYGAKFISSMDINKGFHQIFIRKECRKYCRIITHEGIFQYIRMPFGLKNAPSVFQRFMDKIYHSEIREGWLRLYMDDIIFFSYTFEEHVIHMKKVISKLQEYGVTAAFKKCNFGFENLKALGHRLSGLELAIDENKILAVKEFKFPTSIKEIQSFLGLVGYYRQFIKDFAKIAKPLNELLCKDVVFEMTDTRVKAFNQLKNCIINPTILGRPDFDRPFKLYIDASFTGLGAVLQQEQEKDNKIIEVVICYISRCLKNGELKYGATQLECLGLIWALEKLHYYLDGAKLSVITDCNAVKSLLGLKTPNRHMLRWQMALQQYRGEMTIIHKAGKNHGNADALSRFPLKNDCNNPARVEEPEIEILGIHILDLHTEFLKILRDR